MSKTKRELLSRRIKSSIFHFTFNSLKLPNTIYYNNWTACYPYGSHDNQSIEMLRKKGCKLAVTAEVDIATTNKNTRFIMPRLDTNDIPKDKNEKTNDWYNKG